MLPWRINELNERHNGELRARPQGDLEGREQGKSRVGCWEDLPFAWPSWLHPSFCSTDSGCCGHRKSIPEVSTDTDMGLVIVTLESRHLEHCGDTVLLTPQLGHQATLESAFPEEEMKDFWRLMFQVGPAFHCRLPSKPRRLTAHSAGLLGTNTLD